MGQAQFKINYQLSKKVFSKNLTSDAVHEMQKAIKILQPLIGDEPSL